AFTPGSPTRRWSQTTTGRSTPWAGRRRRPREGRADLDRRDARRTDPGPAPAPPPLPGARVHGLRPQPGPVQPQLPQRQAALLSDLPGALAGPGGLVRRAAGRAGGPAARRALPPPVVPGLAPGPAVPDLPGPARVRR